MVTNTNKLTSVYTPNNHMDIFKVSIYIIVFMSKEGLDIKDK